MLRRTFIQGAGIALGSALAPSTLIAAPTQNEMAIQANNIIDWSSGMKPLYCLAYIDPANKLHRGQERTIAKFPIAVIPQDNRPQFGPFRIKLRQYNPTQKVLAYHATLDEHGVPGPAHDIIRKAKNSWITLPGGITPTIDIPSGKVLKRRIYDPRNLEFRQRFIEACDLLINKYKFEGIFLDNCTIYPKFRNIPFLGDELMEGLQQLITEVRNEFQNAILIGNSSYSWAGLNGEMNEGRPNDLIKEAKSLETHVEPYINMYHFFMKNDGDLVNAEKNFRHALENRCFYGVGVNTTKITWYPFFDKVLLEYRIV